MTSAITPSAGSESRVQADITADGPVEGGLAPLVMLQGRVYAVPGCLHFFPARPSNRISEADAALS